MSLRDILAAAAQDRWGPQGLGPVVKAQKQLDAPASELAAACIEAAEAMRDLRSAYGHLMHVDELAELDALLAHLKRLGAA